MNPAMPIPNSITKRVEAILFDMNGTLRVRMAHEQTQSAAFARLQELIGSDEVDWDELDRRLDAYRIWAKKSLVQLPEAEIWSKWMLPEHPRGRIEPVAAELMLTWSERKGRVVPVPDAEIVILGLRQRGYRLGIISNSMSTLDIPRSLKAFGWTEYFDVVVLSSFLKIRKPSPEPFREAALRMRLSPESCAYLGNRPAKDMPGCKQAGYALGLIIESSDKPRIDDPDPASRPDVVIHALIEMLDIFPDRALT